MIPHVNAYAEMLIARSEARQRAREQEAKDKSRQPKAPPPPPPPSDEFNAANLLRILNE